MFNPAWGAMGALAAQQANQARYARCGGYGGGGGSSEGPGVLGGLFMLAIVIGAIIYFAG